MVLGSIRSFAFMTSFEYLPLLFPFSFFFWFFTAYSFQFLTLLLTSSLPGFASSYIACFVSGPPGPSKSRALVGLGGDYKSAFLCPSETHPILSPAGYVWFDLLARSAFLARLGD